MGNIFLKIGELSLEYGFKVLLAFFVLLLGRIASQILKRVLKRLIARSSLEETLKAFLKSFSIIAVDVVLVIAVLGTLGVEMSSFVALLGAAGLAIGLSLSGTLQNFAGGFILLIFKPFRVGDYISFQNETGTVIAINIFNTVLLTSDNKHIIIPNGGISAATITNYNVEKKRRVDWTIPISNLEHLQQAKAIIHSVATQDKRIAEDPPVFIEIAGMSGGVMDLTVRAWVKTEDYWDVFFAMNANIATQFLEHKIATHLPVQPLVINNG